jgi:hypothetical protein
MSQPYNITNWRKSSRSAGDGECVEVGWTGTVVGFRDTKEAHLPADVRPTLMVGRAAGVAFLASIGAEAPGSAV